MNRSFTYLLVDFFCLVFPFVFSFHPKIKFNKQLRFFWQPCLLTGFGFVLWDILFTHFGIWSFNNKYVSGYYFLNLPLEEVFFFLCIPYACVFTYYCICKLTRASATGDRFFTPLQTSAFLLLVVALFNFNRYYTSVTLVLLAIVFFIMAHRRSGFLKNFFLSYLVILFPFFISNGVLTGVFTAEPVVIYNDHYNLGIRILTIPLEDLFYGMLLLLLNVGGFEYVKSKRLKQLR